MKRSQSKQAPLPVPASNPNQTRFIGGEYDGNFLVVNNS